jgi:hypothetical protein
LETIWTFLNSNLGIWFLSSVVVATITWLYRERAKRNEEAQRKAGRVRPLLSEIIRRLNSAHGYLKLMSLESRSPPVDERKLLETTRAHLDISVSTVSPHKDHSYNALIELLCNEIGEEQLPDILEDCRFDLDLKMGTPYGEFDKEENGERAARLKKHETALANASAAATQLERQYS